MVDNTDYIEKLHAAWREDPASVDPAWAGFFAGVLEEKPEGVQAGVSPVPGMSEKAYKQGRVDSLLWAYRDVGYLYAKLNPLGGGGADHSYLEESSGESYEDLTVEAFGLTQDDLDTSFSGSRSMEPTVAPLRKIVEALRETYCSHIGSEFLHIQNKDVRRWIINRMEACRNRPSLSAEEKRIVLQDLVRTEELERFLGTFFMGQKRFSLEGSEAIIPGLHALVDRAHDHGIEDIVIGTAHRGRLSILNTVLDMTPEEIFAEFEDRADEGMLGGGGDVKYHIGYDTDHVNEDGTHVHVSMVANPSHLESVDPVVQGKARSLQHMKGDTAHKRVLPVLLHGDAAFTGQGVVAETLNMAQLAGYGTGGTVHIVVNNQIGFTTSARSARSTMFPTDIGKMMAIPIFHVNGDDPEALVYVMELALDFRQEFGLDIIVDVFCFRRHGHNEGDEPAFTHPRMYKIIKQHPGVTELYARRCAEEGVLGEDEVRELRKGHRDYLKGTLTRERENPRCKISTSQGPAWDALPDDEGDGVPVDTGVPAATLRLILDRVTTPPEGFSVHLKLAAILASKFKAVEERDAVDWALAESFAFGSLLLKGTDVRLSGEDSTRGTFSQRHLTWWDTDTPKPTPYTPLNALAPDQAHLEAIDSPLSEFSVLGFEYGYSLVRPDALVLWEAQFGDFADGAQVVIDNFIVSAESKWHRRSGLVLLLPHGYEGQGPDHSSARLERFLQMCAEDNIRVCNATTPAQYFHLLRRQVRGRRRVPLVLMTPKSLLRHEAAVSPLEEMTRGSFKTVLDDAQATPGARRLLLCSGKVYYDLLAHRAATGQTDAALVRVEQLYPFPADELAAVLAKYPSARDILWVQEEHKNHGAWAFFRERFSEAFPDVPLRYVGRPERASTATGSHKKHRQEQDRLVAEALGTAVPQEAGAAEPVSAQPQSQGTAS